MADSDIKTELKNLIVTCLRLPDIQPDQLSDDHALLGGDIELDSIDILQLVVEIERKFGVDLVTGRFDRGVWANISTLAASIEERRKSSADSKQDISPS